MNNALKIVFEELEDLKERISSNINNTGRRASGSTEKSLRIEMKDDEGSLLGRKAFETLETGRKPGKVPYNFTKIIAQWIQDKGISYQEISYKRNPSDKWQPKYNSPSERGLMTLASAIAYKISKEGTKLYIQGGESDIYSNEIPKTIDAIKKRIGLSVKTEIVESIKINKK